MPKKSRPLNGHPRSVISYIGGKFQVIENIVPVISYAAEAYGLSTYYEACGGGARMLLNLPSTIFERRIYNEVDLGLCKLFACIGDQRYLYDLQTMVENWGCSEEAFDHAKQARNFERHMMAQGRNAFEMNMVEGAACAFAVAMMSRASDCVTFDHSRVENKNRLRSYFNRVRELDLFYPTLAEVEVTHGDVFELLDTVQEHTDAFVYIDPPYVPEEMILSNHYGERSWTHRDHERLVNVLLGTHVKVALSGYDNRYYTNLEEAGWNKLFLKDVCVSSSGASKRKNSEYLWINFEIPASLEEQISEIDYHAW
ncbi:DNA adenine methylase [Alicyclobacillus curvatus]|nr:DNA adenine methylase [Alicyclobacillus curvatus]